jgi:hypothetical protein
MQIPNPARVATLKVLSESAKPTSKPISPNVAAQYQITRRGSLQLKMLPNPKPIKPPTTPHIANSHQRRAPLVHKKSPAPASAIVQISRFNVLAPPEMNSTTDQKLLLDHSGCWKWHAPLVKTPINGDKRKCPFVIKLKAVEMFFSTQCLTPATQAARKHTSEIVQPAI